MIITVKTLQQKTFKIEIEESASVMEDFVYMYTDTCNGVTLNVLK